jgi:hypothetical protein
MEGAIALLKVGSCRHTPSLVLSPVMLSSVPAQRFVTLVWLSFSEIAVRRPPIGLMELDGLLME